MAKCVHAFVKIHKGPYETAYHCCKCRAEISEDEFRASKAKKPKDDEPEAAEK